jgi:hypothetical protein
VLEEIHLVFNPFIFIRNKSRVNPQRVSLPLKKTPSYVLTPQRAVLPIQSGATARCRLKWLFGALLLNMNLLGRVWEVAEDFNGLKLKKILDLCIF